MLGHKRLESVFLLLGLMSGELSLLQPVENELLKVRFNSLGVFFSKNQTAARLFWQSSPQMGLHQLTVMTTQQSEHYLDQTVQIH